MALFRKSNKQDDVLPDEVKDYYRAEQRDRIGGAWLMAVGGFLLTVAIVLGLFFAGRWAYQAVFVDDDDETVDVIDEAEAPADGSIDDLPDAVTDEPTDTDETDAAADESEETDEEATEAETQDVSPATDARSQANELPRTGPISE